ncbi:hypothetical protein QP745_11130 [Staphylococcus simulans]|uniref:DoxX family protein n=1 Tax=Staphylococcus simulans TaxID=1286 RepID=UPI002555044B|nr:hypothetical protein [Staphylococcus simulans]MDK8176480.1 hypothetical protein [Staphylococcus simulans]
MKAILRFLYSLLLLVAGIGHFTKEKNFERAVPEVLPAKKFIVQFTGILEIIFGFSLWIKKGQSITGKLLAAFMVAVFPANIYMAIKEIPFKADSRPNKIVLWLRLPLQIPLIIGALKLGRK